MLLYAPFMGLAFVSYVQIRLGMAPFIFEFAFLFGNNRCVLVAVKTKRENQAGSLRRADRHSRYNSQSRWIGPAGRMNIRELMTLRVQAEQIGHLRYEAAMDGGRQITATVSSVRPQF